MKKIRVGVLGLGRAGRLMHIPECSNYPDLYEITAVCDNDPERLKNLPAFAEKARLYSSCEELIADPSVDLVSVALRHSEHTPYAIRALEAGKYVFLDKPVALNMAEMLRLKEASDAHPGHLFLRHNRRFEAAFMKIKSLVDSGILGDVSMVKLYRSVGYCRRNDWMTMTRFGGGLLVNWGPHIIDHALRFLGSPVKDCWADLKSVICAGDGEDQIKVLLRGENGRVADVEIHGTTTLPGRLYEIWGTRGTLIYPDENNRIRIRRVEPEIPFPPIEPNPGQPPLRYGNPDETLTFKEDLYDVPDTPMHIIWRKMADAISGKAPYPITFEEGMEVVRVCDMILEKSGFKPGKN